MEVRREEEAALLHRLVTFSRTLHTVSQTDDLVQLILNEAPVVLPLERMSIVLRDEAVGVLRVIGLREGNRVTISRAGTGTTLISPFASMEVQVVNYGAPLYVDDALGGSSVRRGDESVVRSIMVAPMKYAFASASATKRTESFGVVAVGSLRANRYLETEKAIFKELVSVIAVALGVSLDSAQQRRTAAAEATMNAILFKLQGRSSIDEMLRVLASELGQALGANRVRAAINVSDQPPTS